MKKILYFNMLLLLLIGCGSKRTSYTISGEFEGKSNAKVLLLENDEGKFITIDSTQMKNGNFFFSGNIGLPEMYFIKISDKKPINFFVEASDILIRGQVDNLNQVYVTGSATQSKLNTIGYGLKNFDEQKQKLYKQFQKANKNNNESLMNEITNKWNQLQNERIQKIKELVAENSSNVIGPFLVLQNLITALSFDELKSITNNFDSSISESKYVKELKDRINILSQVQIGKTAPDFTLKTPEGDSLSLSDLKGKYLLIDFWASWCSPCRKENPNVVKLYNDYKDKNFTILSVSLDTKKESWTRAIQNDGLVWHHVSDLKGWNNAAADLYGVKGIPHTILLDPEQKIIAKNLRSKNLRNKLSELLD